MTLTFYDAFAGIGGFRLGLESVGFECVGGCEIDGYARQVYKKRFGENLDGDIKEVKDIKGADILCGGFPCQDISCAGKGGGLGGDRSGLWWELARLIEDCKPKWVLLENVPTLKKRGLKEILKFFAESGYTVEWQCLPASAFGAPHQRDRIWIVAYSHGEELRLKSGRGSRKNGQSQTQPTDNGEEELMAYSSCQLPYRAGKKWQRGRTKSTDSSKRIQSIGWWKSEPNVGRVASGVSSRVDRLKCLGNSVVPQVVGWIGERIKRAEEGK